jgi:hypothetical protein
LVSKFDVAPPVGAARTARSEGPLARVGFHARGFARLDADCPFAPIRAAVAHSRNTACGVIDFGPRASRHGVESC